MSISKSKSLTTYATQQYCFQKVASPMTQLTFRNQWWRHWLSNQFHSFNIRTKINLTYDCQVEFDVLGGRSSVVDAATVNAFVLETSKLSIWQAENHLKKDGIKEHVWIDKFKACIRLALGHQLVKICTVCSIFNNCLENDQRLLILLCSFLSPGSHGRTVQIVFRTSRLRSSTTRLFGVLCVLNDDLFPMDVASAQWMASSKGLPRTSRLKLKCILH